MSVNLAQIPMDWGDYAGNIVYDGDPQICFLDDIIVHTAGKPSMRLEPHVEGVDVNRAREIDGKWYAVKAGDVIKYGGWIKIDPLPSGYTVDPQYGGARILFDYYGDDGGIPMRLQDMPELLGWEYDIWHPSQNRYVGYGSDWTWRGATVTVPSTIIDENGNTRVPTSMVLWVQVWDPYAGTIPNANAWFADTELYINPLPPPPDLTIPLVVLASTALVWEFRGWFDAGWFR